MFVEYNVLPENAKVWVYPSSRKFYPKEVEEIQLKLKQFIDSWKSEEEVFEASYQFLHSRFIVLVANTDKIVLTNADIDFSVAFILGLQKTYEVSLLDKMNVCFKQGEFVQYKELKDFKKLLKNKAITGKTIIFDNLIDTKDDLDSFWEKPIEDSWYDRYL